MPSLKFGGASTDRVDSVNSLPAWPTDWTLWLWIYLITATGTQRWFQNLGCDYEIQFNGGSAGKPILCFLSRNGGLNYWDVEANGDNFTAAGAYTNKWMMIINVGKTSSSSNADQMILLADKNKPPAEPSSYNVQDRGSGAIDAATTNRFGNNGSISQVTDGYIWRAGLYSRAMNKADVGRLYIESRRRRLKYRLGDMFCHDFGGNGRGTVLDKSGKKMQGTITGAVPAMFQPGFPYLY